jgi:hypothetical protein
MGLTLFEIGSMIYRPGFDDTPSELEIIIEKTDKICSYYDVINKDNKFFHSIWDKTNTSQELDRELDDENTNSVEVDMMNDNQSSILISSNSTVIIEEEKKEQPEMTVVDIKLNKNEVMLRKGSILKRTASEPKLTITELLDNEIKSDYSSVNNKNDILEISEKNEIKIEKESQKATGTVITTSMNAIKTKNRSLYKKELNLKQINNEDQDSIDSPFNEFYFHNFEILLIEFLKKTKQK